ncbi:MAG: serine/threonine protein kinase [Myxococcales bacterium]|nr:serine/threonine protein kinase [Myxococcales bacterium]
MRRVRSFGPYRLLYRVASGGMAEVYRARLDQAELAIKRLLPQYNTDAEFLVMLADEARITGLLDHPNIVKLYEFGVVDEQHFLAMEFVDGVDLRALQRRCADRGISVPPAAAVWVVEQALRGLDFAHQQRGADGQALRLVHRDFSPSNLLIGFDGAVKLIDFGIAKDRLSRARTRGGMIKGKVRYMSPEQTEGRRLDPRSDVFSAGAALYQAAVGRPPFVAEDDAALMVAIRDTPHAPASHQRPVLGAAFDAVLDRALAKDAADRYPTARAFADALKAWRANHAPDYHQGALGEWVSRLFEAERTDARTALGELDLHGELDESLGSLNTQYTRLVDAGWRTASGVHPMDLGAELDAWLARTRGELTQETSPGAPPTDP